MPETAEKPLFNLRGCQILIHLHVSMFYWESLILPESRNCCPCQWWKARQQQTFFCKIGSGRTAQCSDSITTTTITSSSHWENAFRSVCDYLAVTRNASWTCQVKISAICIKLEVKTENWCRICVKALALYNFSNQEPVDSLHWTLGNPLFWLT